MLSYTVVLVGDYAPDKQRSMRRFILQLAEGLSAQGAKVEIFHPAVHAGRILSGTSGLGKWLGYIDKYIFAPIALKRLLRSIDGPLVVHICDHSNAHYTKVLDGIPNLVTCHDLLAVRSALGEFEQNQTRWFGRQQQSIIIRGLKRAQHIASVSGATDDDVGRILKTNEKQRSVIPNSLDDAFIRVANDPLDEDKPTHELVDIPQGAPFIMHIGGNAWYKNRELVLSVFSKMAGQSAELYLLIVGPEFSTEELERNQCTGLINRIRYGSGIDDATLRSIYSKATLLLFPSYIEGFGWPILEAQACRCPVATLDRAPMNTLNALPELLMSGEDASHAAAQCLEYIQKSDVDLEADRQQISTFASKFTNDASATAYKTLYLQLIQTEDFSKK
ncbi:MAG: glycosyltransferase [Opitutaceae bacterium]